MDENVIFDNQNQAVQQQGDGQQNTGDQGVSDGTVDQAAPDQAAVSASTEDQAVAADGTAVEQLSTDETGAELQTEAGAGGGEEPSSEEAPPPPPPGILGFLQNPLIKKILIGVGILVLLIILVIIFMPKGKKVEHVTLTWWGLWEDQNVVNALIKDFEKQNPNITVQYQKQDAGSNQYRDRLLQRIQNNTGPDIFRYHNTWVPMLSEVLLPLSQDVISPEEFQKNYYPVVQTDLVRNGGIYGIPIGFDTLALFTNTEIFEAAGVGVPNNWDDFYKAAVALTVKDPDTEKIKTAGAALGTFDNVTHASDIVSLFFVQQGVNMQKFTTDTQNEIDALKFYVMFANPEDGVWDSTLDASILAFAKGNLAMYMGYSWDIFQIQQLNSKLKFKIYPVPGLYGKNKTIASYWVEGVSSRSSHKPEALLFMKYLSQKETSQLFYKEASKTRLFGEPYARTDLAETLKSNELIYPFVQQGPNAVSSIFVSDTHDGDGGINLVSNNYLNNAVNEMSSNSSPQSTIETLQQGVAQVFQKYGIGQ